jgi:hypothetical protein
MIGGIEQNPGPVVEVGNTVLLPAYQFISATFTYISQSAALTLSVPN